MFLFVKTESFELIFNGYNCALGKQERDTSVTDEVREAEKFDLPQVDILSLDEFVPE